MYVCMYVCMHACMHACMCVCMHVCAYACNICMHPYACMHDSNSLVQQQQQQQCLNKKPLSVQKETPKCLNVSKRNP